MHILIGVLGVVVAVFGIVVTIRYHDRPGGTLRWLGMELSSTGAGLPLVALGVLSLIAATILAPDAKDDRNLQSGTSDSVGIAVDSQQSIPDTSRRADVDTVVRSFAVSETNDDHKTLETNTKSYEKTFRADSGYSIVAYKWQEESATRQSDLIINILDGGASIQISFKLKAGPKTDRYRGWLRGALVTTQIRRIELD
jgi:hypothetical protein